MWKKEEFGKTLRRGRKSKGYSQRALGERAGISERTIRSLEKGQGIPSVATVYKLARGLERSVEELLPPQEG